MMLLFRRLTLRHWFGAPRTTLLLVLTLALGVAVYLSICIANKAAVSGFTDFTELVSAQSDFIVQAPAGKLPESVLEEMRTALEPYAVTLIPIVETTAAKPRPEGQRASLHQGQSFTIFGIDLVALQNLRAGRGSISDDDQEKALGWLQSLSKPGAVFISSALAKTESLQPGSEFQLVIQDEIKTLRVAGILPDRANQASMPETLLLMDLPALQRLASRDGTLDRVEFLLGKGSLGRMDREAVRVALEKLSRDRWQLTTPQNRREAASLMTRAFRWNLGILSLLALLVGLYLVFQALDGAVVRRREEIGILRSLGVEPGDIQRLWLLESLLLGTLGGSLGALLGWAGAQAAVGVVGMTVNTLYHATHTQAASLTWNDFGVAMALGMGASLVAGWFPAQAAAMTPPAQILSRNTPQPLGAALWRSVWLGPGLLLLALVLTSLPPVRLEGGARFALAGYFAALFAVLGGGLLAGNSLRLVAWALQGLQKHSLTAQLALSHLRRASSRHRLAVAALLCAVAMTSGMAILVGSFDKTMRGWIDRTFQADIYVSSEGAQGASSQNLIREETVRAIAARPDVAEVNTVHFVFIQVPEGDTMLASGDLGFMGRRVNMAWMQAPTNDAISDSSRNESLCLVSESFSERFLKKRGDQVKVPTPAGEKTLTIEGVYCDYGNERGSITVDRVHFEKWFQDKSVSRVILFVKPGVDPEGVRSELMKEHTGLSVFTNEHLRGEVMRIFRQTFAITNALELIGIFVAVVGLGMTLASVLLERRAELTTLRALGLTRREMAQASAWEGLLLALTGVTCGLLVSLGLGWLLVHVINKQTFGWTLQFHLPWPEMLVLAVLVLVSAGVVSWFTGRWGSGLAADREE
jgi:putative ABC transport system permease protein